MVVGDPTGYLLGGCGCGLHWTERDQCAECTARAAAWVALQPMFETICPECYAEGAGRPISPKKVETLQRAAELLAMALATAARENPGGPTGVVPPPKPRRRRKKQQPRHPPEPRHLRPL